MKRTERRHLKKNELASFAAQASELLEEHRRELTAAVVVIVVLGGAMLAWYGWRQYVQSRAHALLADAMALEGAPVGPPQAPGANEGRFATEHDKLEAERAKFKAAADAYPSTDAGNFARSREASISLALGMPDQAAAAYQQVIDRAGNSLYGQMAKLGLAEAQASGGHFDQAIATFKDLTQNRDGSLPQDGVLIQLARVYRDAGKRTEAEQTLDQIVRQYPDSVFGADAKRELDDLKKTT